MKTRMEDVPIVSVPVAPRRVIFTNEERMLIEKLVSQDSFLLMNKKTDASSISIKNKKWQEITMKFNEITGSNRTGKQIKKCFHNLKASRRRDLSDGRKEGDFQFLAGEELDVDINLSNDSDSIYLGHENNSVECIISNDMMMPPSETTNRLPQAQFNFDASTCNIEPPENVPKNRRKRLEGLHYARLEMITKKIEQATELHNVLIETARIDQKISEYRMKAAEFEMKRQELLYKAAKMTVLLRRRRLRREMDEKVNNSTPVRNEPIGSARREKASEPGPLKRARFKPAVSPSKKARIYENNVIGHIDPLDIKVEALDSDDSDQSSNDAESRDVIVKEEPQDDWSQGTL